MNSESASWGRGQQRSRARVASALSLCGRLAGVLLLAGACGGSEGSRSTPPLPNDAADAGALAPVSPPGDSASPGPDAGTGGPSSGEVSGAETIPRAPDDPADDPAASDDPPASIDLELACSSGQAQVICLDTESVVLCVSGLPIESTCSTLCDSYGRDTGPCDDGCQCGEPTNPRCVQASEDFCACSALTGNEPCTPQTLDRFYLACVVNGIGGALMACTADFRATRPDAPIDATFCTDLDDACN